MTGIRLAAAVALILAITAQLIIGTPGLGAEIARAQSGGACVDVLIGIGHRVAGCDYQYGHACH